MNSQRLLSVLRWLGVGACLAGIITFYRLIVHANATTVALTFLLLILFVAAKLGLRYAIVTSLAATAGYNFFFLPPVDTFTVSDPQNLLALVAFLVTSVFASRLSDRIRAESAQAQKRSAELEVLYSLSRGLLQTDEVGKLTNAVPAAAMHATGAKSVLFYLLDGDRTYRAGQEWPSSSGTGELRALANAPGVSITSSGDGLVPLKTGVRPRGLLILRGFGHSTQTLEAIGGLVSVSLDRARVAEEIVHSEAIQESERFRTLILDSITQQLRTPLASIKGSVGTLLIGNVKEETSRELLSVIDEESDRLNRLISEAIEMAQLDTQQTSLNVGSQSLAVLIEAAIFMSAEQLGEHQVIVRLQPSLPLVLADYVSIQRVLVNLIENAANFSAPDQPITISAEVCGGMVACSVADRGVGIDPSEQPFVFDKLYKSQNHPRHSAGSGMGLAICRAIIAAHNGKISVTSQVGQGSVFTFTLPI